MSEAHVGGRSRSTRSRSAGPASEVGAGQSLTNAEWARLGGFAGAVLFLHLLGWGLFLYYARTTRPSPVSARSPTPSASGTPSTPTTSPRSTTPPASCCRTGSARWASASSSRSGTRRSCSACRRPRGRHRRRSTRRIPGFQEVGGYIGASVSGTFLLVIGILNLIVLLDILGVFRQMKRGVYNEQKLEDALQSQGLMSRFFLKRVGDKIDTSWKMYPLGILFGLGFDTATEIGLLAIAAGVATHQVPFLAIISLPIIFAAAMSLMDTADGAFMSQAYGWAFSNPVRKVYYNITVTSLSVAVALIIGTIELLQVMAAKFSLEGGFWDYLDNLNFGNIGYVVVGLFVATWAFSVILWKTRRIEDRWGALLERS